MPCSLGAPKKTYVPCSFHNSLKSRIKTFCPTTQASDMAREKGSPTSKGTLFPPSQPPKYLVSGCPLFQLTILFQFSAPLVTSGQQGHCAIATPNLFGYKAGVAYHLILFCLFSLTN